jgi:hypothetical protein
MNADDPWKVKAEVFEKSYDEVLAGLKHQDEKLNRTLTAIAFLTAAGVAIFANIAIKAGPPVVFPHEAAIRTTSFFFVTFLSFVVFALAFALAAIGPSEALPRLAFHEYKPQLHETWPSLLFYAKILRDPDWTSHIEREASWLKECIARNFHSECYTLAKRVDYKIARSRESGACVQLAVLSLSLLGIFSVRQFSIDTRWWIASVLFIGTLALPLWDGLLMFKFAFKDVAAMSERKLAYGAVAINSAAGVALLLLAPYWHAHWWAIAYALASILTVRLAIAYERLKRLRRGLLCATAVAGPTVLLLAWLV